jgi:hypothetical protein
VKNVEGDARPVIGSTSSSKARYALNGRPEGHEELPGFSGQEDPKRDFMAFMSFTVKALVTTVIMRR